MAPTDRMPAEIRESLMTISQRIALAIAEAG
ncbi:hypothetical protein HBJ16_005344, partial [Pseudomonas sp. CES]